VAGVFLFAVSGPMVMAGNAAGVAGQASTGALVRKESWGAIKYLYH
jgi:hypothetical protein